MEIPDDFHYTWQSVGAGYLCAFCPPRKVNAHSWRAHSEKYGDVYVCPRHLHYMQTALRGERGMLWVALRSKR